MSIPTSVHFEAAPDLTLIRFSTGFAGCAVFQLRFAPVQPGIYDAAVEYLHGFPDALYIPLTNDQIEELQLALIQMIELYTQKYPERIIRLKGGGSKLQTMLFRVIILAHLDVLRHWFIIDEEQRQSMIPLFKSRLISTFFLKRRPDTCLPDHPIQTILHTRSRLFGNPVQVRVREGSQSGDSVAKV